VLALKAGVIVDILHVGFHFVLGNRSMRRLKAPTVGALPPASMQSYPTYGISYAILNSET